jgi:sugar phosphate isomerase/epimerase
MSIFTLSAFGDELAPALEDQLRLLNELRIDHIDVRMAWGVNVAAFTDKHIVQVRELCVAHAIKVSSVGSPIGKSPLLDPIENELRHLARVAQVAAGLGTRNIRIFSFYPPDTSTNTHYDTHVDAVVERLGKLVELAAQFDLLLLLENEKDIVGDTPERCYAIARQIDSPHLRLIWDPANFVQTGVANVTDQYWEMLNPYVVYIHVKDAVLSDGSVRAAGEGDGQIRELLARLVEAGQPITLALEPHLQVAGHSSGFTGMASMKYAVAALRKLIAEVEPQA